MENEINKRKMLIDIEYAMQHGEWDTWYRVVRIWNVLQYIKKTDDSFCDMCDIESVKQLFDLWNDYKTTVYDQSIQCIEHIYNLIKN